MNDKKLLFDRKCHVLYSKPCKKEILAKIALHRFQMKMRDRSKFHILQVR